ncbi:MAG TPA: PQQ-binding-like beta-propeller repeat protein [Polyangiaceae bacterium]|nr:PQQ-binding-like beta-propeller repeat protein [Polyangiaceae bacterium]
MSRAALVASVVSLLTAACGGGAVQTAAFATDWQSDGGKSIAAVAAKVGKPSLPDGGGLAVGVTDSGLVASSLDGAHHWKHPGRVDSRPAIAGDVVVFTSAGSLVALDANTGKELWKTSVGEKRLRGAGDDGRLTVASLGGGSGGGTLLVTVDRNGSVVRRWTPDVEVGVPAVASGFVFAPWGNQYVSALDVSSGKEEGRLLGRLVMSRAVVSGGSIYFGEHALLRFDDEIGKAPANGGHTVKLPDRELPGKPFWFPSGEAVLPVTAGAPDSIRFYARPAETNGKLGIDSDRFAATYFRVVVAFNAHDGTLRWARTFPDEIIGGDAATAGFVFCDESGKVWLADARAGGDSGSVALGEPLRSCVVRAGSYQVKPGKDSGTLAEQIAEAINLRETQMAMIQRFLLRELGTGEDPAITKTLLDLASDARTQPDVLDEAKNLLSSRRNGVEYMLDALSRHYDYLSDVLRPPPVGPLADALAAVGEKKAAPLLAAHLNDPADSPNDVRHAAHALVTLATGDELPAVRTFFSLYRATADEEDLIAAVIDAAKILVALDGPSGVELVQRAAADPMTQSAVREGISNLAPKSG